MKGRFLSEGAGNNPLKDDRVSSGPDQTQARSNRISSGRSGLASWRFRFRRRAPDTGYPDFSKRADERSEWSRRLADQRLLWSAFAFAGGIALYVLLPEEPDFFAVSALFSAGCLCVLTAYRRSRLTAVGGLIFAAIAGAFFADLRTTIADAPRLAEARTFTITGRVTDRADTRRGPRLTIDVEEVAELPPGPARAAFPRRVRVSVPDAAVTGIGDTVTVRTRLAPPSGPVRPGGYDFSFRAYFEGIGATGFSYGVPKQAVRGATPLLLKAERALADLRGRISARIAMLLGTGDASALAAALLVGDRSGLSSESEEALRQAGLAHILAISGLHMALFAGGTYAVLLMLLSLSQTAALHYPTHRIAAIAALLAACCYLALSGASVATQRSFIMVFLVFLGVLTGRRGLTLRSVAVAGLILLVLAPERLFHPGFQMSFAAVICLVAVYDTWRHGRRDRLAKERSRSTFVRVAGSLGRWVSGLFLTALIAGTATGLIGTYHFGRVAPFGLIGNMLGMPVFSLIVMPMGVMALVLMPFGLASVPLQIMAIGLNLILRIAEWTAGLGAHGGAVPIPDALTALLATAALFLLVLIPGKRKIWSALPFAAALISTAQSRPPDVQIADRGQLIAARDENGTLRLHANRAGFVTDNWLQAEGLPVAAFADQRMAAPQFACDDEGCLYRAYPGGRRSSGLASLLSFNTNDAAAAEPAEPLLLALPKTAGALHLDCRYADVIVTALAVPENCGAGLVIDARRREQLGAVSIWLALPPETALKPHKTGIAHWRAAKTVPPRPWHK